MRKLTNEDIAGVIGTKNANCTIEKARVKGGEFIDSDHYGIVLAQSESGNFITWQFHLVDGKPEYYWGHYFMVNGAAAVKDFKTRD